MFCYIRIIKLEYEAKSKWIEVVKIMRTIWSKDIRILKAILKNVLKWDRTFIN